MQKQKINPRQRLFLRLYLGRDMRYYGHATEAYKKAYEYSLESDRSAQSLASNLMNRPLIAAEIAKADAEAAKQTGIDATFVLKQSLRLYDRAMGDEEIETETTRIDQKTGKKVTATATRRDYNPQVARAALELIGRHTSVQAFQDNVEHTHTHRLEQALARRSKIVEARALNQAELPAPGDDRVVQSVDRVPDAPQAEENKKRVHPAGGQTNCAAPAEKTSFESAEASG